MIAAAAPPGPAAAATAGPARRRPLAAAAARAAAAAAAGALAGTALPPWGFLPGLLGFSALAWLLAGAGRPPGAAALGWAFGLGWFGVGLHWVAIAFEADAERFGALAAPAVAGLVAACALFPAAAAWLVARLGPWRSPEAAALALAAAWTLGEQLRGSWGLRFPWNPAAVAWAADDRPLQAAALLGAPGLTFVTVLAAGLLAAGPLARGAGAGRRALGPAAAALIVGGLYGAGALRLAAPEPAGPEGIELRLVQASVPQDLKWDPARREGWFLRHVELSLSPRARPADLVVWPESAVPYAIDRDPAVREALGRAAAPGGTLVTGGNRVVEGEGGALEASNSLWAVAPPGEVRARYDKVDLVPFGEYLPFRPVLGRLGLDKLAAGSFDFAPGPGRRTLAPPGLPPFSPLVCYEAIYPGAAVDRGGPRPAFLLNITNDAWFGRSAGPHQHLAMARTRAVEEGLPLVRAANNGLTVVTDARGRVVASLPQDAVAALDARLPAALPAAPPYARLGWRLVAALLLAAGLGAWLLERGAPRRRPAR